MPTDEDFKITVLTKLEHIETKLHEWEKVRPCEKHEKQLSDLEKNKNYMSGIYAVFGAAGYWLLTWITKK